MTNVWCGATNEQHDKLECVFIVIVLMLFTSSAYERIAHPVGKCYAINIEAEKRDFNIVEKRKIMWYSYCIIV